MRYAAQPSLMSRATSALFSVVIPAAVGFALFASFVTGAPEANFKPGQRGQVVVVHLPPLPEGGSSGEGRKQQSSAASGKAGSEESMGEHPAAQGVGAARAIGSPPKGDGGSGDTSGTQGVVAADDSRAGAPVLSGAEVQAFRSRLLHHIERFRRYPPEARKAGDEGAVRIQFVMDRSGNVIEAWVELSSGSALLDAEAIAAVMRAQPLPVPPDHWPQSFGVSLPIGFALQ